MKIEIPLFCLLSVSVSIRSVCLLFIPLMCCGSHLSGHDWLLLERSTELRDSICGPRTLPNPPPSALTHLL